MFPVLKKRRLNDTMVLMEVGAPFITEKTRAGQFTILCVNEFGERTPLTITDHGRKEGAITITFQRVGRTTLLLDQPEEGGKILDFIRPPGTASHLDGYKKTAMIGGDAGCVIAYPQAKALHEIGAHVDMIVGFRSQDIITLEGEIHAASNDLFLITDDDSDSNKGFITGALKAQINAGADYDLVVAIDPLPTMCAVSNLTRPYGIKAIISMNPIMTDNTGMCGGCRVIVGGETKFACVDGPDFDGYLVDFDEAVLCTRTYREDEVGTTHEYNCYLMKGAKNG